MTVTTNTDYFPVQH